MNSGCISTFIFWTMMQLSNHSVELTQNSDIGDSSPDTRLCPAGSFRLIRKTLRQISVSEFRHGSGFRITRVSVEKPPRYWLKRTWAVLKIWAQFVMRRSSVGRSCFDLYFALPLKAMKIAVWKTNTILLNIRKTMFCFHQIVMFNQPQGVGSFNSQRLATIPSTE